jgi:hypothetical protein
MNQDPTNGHNRLRFTAESSYPYKPKYPKMAAEVVLEKQASDIESLIVCNNILKEHLDFLRNKIEKQQKQIELFTELIVTMEERMNGEQNLELYRINLN